MCRRKPVILLPHSVNSLTNTPEETIDWGLEMFGIPDLWRISRGSGIRIAVLDTGIDESHPDLRDSIVSSKDHTGSQKGVIDTDGHGTHVAGIIGARENGTGVVGVAPNCDLIIGKVFDNKSQPLIAPLIDGIVWAVEQDVDIINISIGLPDHHDRLMEVVRYAADAGVHIICAAGNNGSSAANIHYPAAYPETIAVGAIDIKRKVASYSSHGDAIDIVAPGNDIFSTMIENSYKELSGTSMAAPFVTGIAALILAKQKESGDKPSETHCNELIDHLRKTSVDAGPGGFDTAYGFGVIDPETLLHDINNEAHSVLDTENDVSAPEKDKHEADTGAI